MNLNDIYRILNLEDIAEAMHVKEKEYYEKSQLEDCLKQIQEHVKSILVRNPNTPSNILIELLEDEKFKGKASIASNPNTPTEILYQLYEEGYSQTLVYNPKIPADLMSQIYTEFYTNSDNSKRGKGRIPSLYTIAQNPNTPQDILRILSESEEELSASTSIKEAVAKNPNTPVDILEILANNQSFYSGANNVLRNPNIPEELLNKIIEKHGLYNIRQSILDNTSVSPEIIREIELSLHRDYDSEHTLSYMLRNPNTPTDIIEKYSNYIDYSEAWSGNLYSTLNSILKNPNVPSQVLVTIKEKLEKTFKGTSWTLPPSITKLLENPNAPKDIIIEYLGRDGAYTDRLDILYSTLENPNVFEALQEMQLGKSTPLQSTKKQVDGQDQYVMDWLEGRTETLLQQKEAELSSLEAEEKTITETEKLIAQKENEGQTI